MKTLGPWIVGEQIGRGGQGETYEVTRAHSDEPGRFALKRIKKAGQDEKRFKRFQLEIETCRQIAHPNIVRIVDHNLDGDNLYYVMPLCELGSLSKWLPAQQNLDLVERLRIFKSICSGLHAAHEKRVVHRDIKPENILLKQDSESHAITPVIVDFGICHLIDDEERLTDTQENVGSRYYIAPELAKSP